MRDEADEYHAATYAPILATLKRIYKENPAVMTQLEAVEISHEDWDLNGGGGHFKMCVPDDVPAIGDDVVECAGVESDGGFVQVLLHTVGGRLYWGEWFKVDPDSLFQMWPPAIMGRADEIYEIRKNWQGPRVPQTWSGRVVGFRIRW